MDDAVDQGVAQAMLDNGKVVLATDYSIEDYSGTTTVATGQFVKLLPFFCLMEARLMLVLTLCTRRMAKLLGNTHRVLQTRPEDLQ